DVALDVQRAHFDVVDVLAAALASSALTTLRRCSALLTLRRCGAGRSALRRGRPALTALRRRRLPGRLLLGSRALSCRALRGQERGARDRARRDGRFHGVHFDSRFMYSGSAVSAPPRVASNGRLCRAANSLTKVFPPGRWCGTTPSSRTT